MGSAGRINGLLALVAILPGCDKVFGLDTPAQTTPCGVFDEPVPVAIDPDLVNPVRLTMNHLGEGGLGVVNARLKDMGSRRDYTVIWQDDMWKYDPTRMNGMDELANLQLRHATATRHDENRMYGSLELSNDDKAHLFALQRGIVGDPTKWVQEGAEIAATSNQDSFPGGELVDTIPGYDDVQRSLPIFRRDFVDGSWTTAIAERAPGDMTTFSDATAGGLPATQDINDTQWPTGGSLIRLQKGKQKNAEVLFYSARPRGDTAGAEIYVTQRKGGRFLVGTPIATINSDQEDVEPWVDEACTTIVFRRADPAGDSTSDDGDTITDGVLYQSTIIDGTGPAGS
ncbi:MAG TPA: hypothetical protein VGM39_01895 [Kofleriaceae bacterium]